MQRGNADLMTYPIKEVRPGIYRGPRPDGEREIVDISRLGIKFILNLEDKKDIAVAEKNLACAYGITVLRDPWGEILPPSFGQLEDAAVYISHFNPILVHCLHGQDRTGAAILADRIVNSGWSFDKAYREMLDEGHHVFFYFWWRKRLKEFSRKYGRD